MSQDKKFIIYCTAYCADCFRSIKIFERLNVDYEYIDIDQDQIAARKVEEINRGNQSVPTIVFPDNTILIEPLNIVLEEKLKDYIKNTQ